MKDCASARCAGRHAAFLSPKFASVVVVRCLVAKLGTLAGDGQNGADC